MNEIRNRVGLVCWLFVSALFLSTVQVTLAGHQSGSSPWFDLLTNVMAEEENEDSEKEERVKEAQTDVPRSWLFMIDLANFSNHAQCSLTNVPVHPEITSPPPEA